MIPGIDPKVDIAFTKLFGTPAWRHLTVSLINAVLELASTPRVADLDLLNPYSQKIAPDDKLTILDVKARDEQGRAFDVEMQMELVPSLPRRLLFYWAQMYAQQLVEGDNYATLCPAISICFLNQVLFPGRDAIHTVFRLADPEGRLCLTRDLEIHVIEIPKFTLGIESLEKPLDFWLYFFKNGKELDADALPAPLARSEIRQAMEVLKVFSQDQLERDLYENRLKGQRDHQAFVDARDQAVQELDQAKRDVKEGLARQIQLCQRLLGHDLADTSALLGHSTDDLRAMAERLEQQLPPQ